MGGALETPPRRLIRPSLLFTEVSPLCICHRLPRVATPILTHPLYRSLPEEGHRAVGINLAWYFNADTSERTFRFSIQLSSNGEVRSYFSLHYYLTERGCFLASFLSFFEKLEKIARSVKTF